MTLADLRAMLDHECAHLVQRGEDPEQATIYLRVGNREVPLREIRSAALIGDGVPGGREVTIVLADDVPACHPDYRGGAA